MNSLVESLEHDGYTVEIHRDDDCDSPRSHESNLGVFLGFPNRSYDIGDSQFDPRTYTRTCPVCLAEDRDPQCPRCEGFGEVSPTNEAQLMEWLREDHGARVIRKVGMIDHSGISFYMGGGASAADPGGWDSGTCGYIMDTPERLAEMDCELLTDEQIAASLTSEIEDYSAWSSGDAYGVVIKDGNGDQVHSCWGYIGYDHVMQSWQDMVPTDPPPALLRTVRLTDEALALLETLLAPACIGTADDAASTLAAAVLTTLRAAAG